MIVWNFLQDNAGAFGVILTVVGALYAGLRRLYKAQQAADERRKKEIVDIVESNHAEAMSAIAVVVERHKEQGECLIRVEERQKENAERLQWIGKTISDMKDDIRAIWQPAVGAFFGRKSGQRNGNRPNDF